MRRPVARSAVAGITRTPHAKIACHSIQSILVIGNILSRLNLFETVGGLELNSTPEADPSCLVTHPGIKYRLLRNAYSRSWFRENVSYALNFTLFV